MLNYACIILHNACIMHALCRLLFSVLKKCLQELSPKGAILGGPTLSSLLYNLYLADFQTVLIIGHF